MASILTTKQIVADLGYPLLGKDPANKLDEFLEKCQMGGGGGGGVFNPKINAADFGNYKQGFLIMKLIQNANFRGGGVEGRLEFFFQKSIRFGSRTIP